LSVVSIMTGASMFFHATRANLGSWRFAHQKAEFFTKTKSK
jgi:hypothetical protein